MKRFVGGLSVVIFVSSFSFGETNIVISQPDSPVEILKLASTHGKTTRDDDYVFFEARWKSVAAKAIIAVKFSFHSYDLFNERLGGVAGVDINRDMILADEIQHGRWRAYARGVASAHETGIGYVQKVRFFDGTLWIADTEHLNTELEKVLPGSESLLKE